MEHELKCWPAQFQAVRANRKRFEFRRADRNYNEGDTLWLREWDPKRPGYTGNECRRQVTYVMFWGFGLPKGFCVMSIEELLP